MSIAATLIFCESLERNVHFFYGNVDFLRESGAKRPFLSRQRSFFYETLERNVHFYDGNVDFLRESRTKRTCLSLQLCFFTRVSSETYISMLQTPKFATVTQIQRAGLQLTRSQVAG